MASSQIGVLGPVEAFVDSTPVALGASKQRAVLSSGTPAATTSTGTISPTPEQSTVATGETPATVVRGPTPQRTASESPACRSSGELQREKGVTYG